MITLAIECSSRLSSLALLRGQETLQIKEWIQDRQPGSGLFPTLPDFLDEAEIELAGVHRFVCGRGPGIFSSNRVAMSAATCAALPSGAEVYALSSGEALAADILAGQPGRVAVVGDARRSRWWYGLFASDGTVLTCERSWSLCRPDDLPEQVGKVQTVVSPDYERLQSAFAADGPLAALPWVNEQRVAKAVILGRRALERIARTEPSEPLTPIYLHPAVANQPETRSS